jgi:Putative metal-binding motif
MTRPGLWLVASVERACLGVLLAAVTAGCNDTAPPATCPSPCFIWEYCDGATHTCLGNPCNLDVLESSDPGAVSVPVVDVAECGLGAKCFNNACVVNPCINDAQCSDGVFCNGTERCVTPTKLNPRGCVASPPPCDGHHTCNESTHSCSTECTHPDLDGDGHAAIDCGGDDCNDNDPNAYPGNTEVCDPMGHDEDCDPSTYGPDKDGDGFVAWDCCQIQRDGMNHCGADCDDTNPLVSPYAPEICDHRDNNCNGEIDEGVTITAYADADLDGVGAGPPMQICPQDLTAGLSLDGNDCDDTNPAIVPGSMICGNPQAPTKVQICLSDGGWFTTDCLKGQNCFPEPNGTGTCR